MEMIAVLRVGIWSQNGPERPTGIIMYGPQLFAKGPRSPAVQHGDRLSIGQREPTNIDRLTLAMF